MAIAQRDGFSRLIDKMEPSDVLVVTKPDRLGRDAIDVSMTLARLEKMGTRVSASPWAASISPARLEK